MLCALFVTSEDVAIVIKFMFLKYLLLAKRFQNIRPKKEEKKGNSAWKSHSDLENKKCLLIIR